MRLRLVDRTWDNPRAAVRVPVRTVVVLTSWMWVPAVLALAVVAGTPLAGAGVGAFAREVRVPFRALWALAVPTYVAFFLAIRDSFVSGAADAYERRQAVDMAPLYGLLANAVTAVLLAVALAVLCVILGDNPTHAPTRGEVAPSRGLRDTAAEPFEIRKRISIDDEDADLLLSFCEPGSTLKEPRITDENYRRFVVAQAEAERQRRLRASPD
jgi:hypothetical protein